MPKKIRILKKELWNLDLTLADIIHQYLVAFKASERHCILYSTDYENPDFKLGVDIPKDDSDWLLDELIWTFETLSRGGETPELEELVGEVFGGFTIENGKLVSKAHEHPRYEEYKALEKEINERIQKGLELFAKHFRGLWD